MNNLLLNKLEEVFIVLNNYNLPVVKLLQEPLSKTEIEKSVNKIQVKLHEDILNLYQWKNGVDDSWEFFLSSSWIFPGAGFYSLKRTIEVYHEFAGSDEFWTNSKFMVFESGAGDMLIMECDVNSNYYGMIYQYNLGATNYEVMITKYDSLTSLLDTIIKCYNEKIYSIDPLKGVNRINYDFYLREVEISKEYNPKSEYWKLF